MYCTLCDSTFEPGLGEQCRCARPRFDASPTPSVPDYCEPIIGWRVWVVDDRGAEAIEPPPALIPVFDPTAMITFHTRRRLRLASRFRVTWPPYEALEAQHLADSLSNRRCPGSPCDGHVPYERPQCGIYAFREEITLRRVILDAAATSTLGRSFAVGTVALWGRGVEHECGYRAQFAYPARFVYAHGCDLAQLGEAYGVPAQEDPAWKSALHSAASSQNRSEVLYPSGFQIVPLTPQVYTPKTPSGIALRHIRNYQQPLPSHPLINPPTWVPPTLSPNLSILPGNLLAYSPNIWYSPTPPFVQQPPLARKKLRELLEQPSFNLHKPLRWVFDKAQGLWLRIWGDEDTANGVCSWCGLHRRACRAVARATGLGCGP
jgi:hypothetical protein